MCAGMGCPYELYDGGCKKLFRLPCPFNDEDVDVYERWQDIQMERMIDESREDKECCHA